jgi:hypothetical protein
MKLSKNSVEWLESLGAFRFSFNDRDGVFALGTNSDEGIVTDWYMYAEDWLSLAEAAREIGQLLQEMNEQPGTNKPPHTTKETRP